MNDILYKSIEHLYLSSISVFIALIISIILFFIYYFKPNNFIINILSMIQAIPSLALFALLVPIIGIGPTPTILVLVLYALLPLYNNLVLGFKSIDPNYYDIKHNLSIDNYKFFTEIELPHLIPYLVKGLRLAYTYSLSFATIATLIGAGGLGDYIYLGLQTMNIYETLKGVIPLLLIILLINIILMYVENIFRLEARG